MGPAIVRSSSRGSVSYTRTSGRREAKRWSPTMYSAVMPMLVSSMKGTGFAGSLTYSSKASPASAGPFFDRRPLAERKSSSGFAST